MGVPFVSYSTAPLRVDIVLPQLTHSLGAVDAARMLLLHVAGVVLPWLLLRVDLVSLVESLVAVLVRVQVLGPGVSLTAPRRSCAPCDSPLTGDWHLTSLSQGS